MAQSVKLSDGSYIDASAVYDTDRQETVEDALKQSYLDVGPYIEAAGFTHDTSFALKQGHMVTLNVTPKSGTSASPAYQTWLTLPEGYRPPKAVIAYGQELTGNKTNLYVLINPDGTVQTYTQVTANYWWSFNVTYWVD